jgi:hypothetical protein
VDDLVPLKLFARADVLVPPAESFSPGPLAII